VQLRLQRDRRFRRSSGRPAKSRPRNRHQNRHLAGGGGECGGCWVVRAQLVRDGCTGSNRSAAGDEFR